MLKFAVVVSQFNPEITDGLLSGAKNYFREKDITSENLDIFFAPGAFEIPLIAQKVARTGRYQGVVCLGCVTKGDTAHFEFISLGSTIGIMQSMLSTGIPMSFGILTTYNDDQAHLRSRDNTSNKGREAAAACYETVKTLATIF